jgi:hypothetical protein
MLPFTSRTCPGTVEPMPTLPLKYIGFVPVHWLVPDGHEVLFTPPKVMPPVPAMNWIARTVPCTSNCSPGALEPMPTLGVRLVIPPDP